MLLAAAEAPLAADAPSADAPSADAPSADAPSADAPSADAPSADAPSADAPSADVPSADVPSADAPNADAPAADAPSADAPAAERATADAPARPELPPGMDLPLPPVWERQLEIGAAIAYVARPLFHDRPPSAASYLPNVGFAVQLRWDVLSFLRFSPYFYHVSHGLVLPPGALTADRSSTVSRNAALSETTASSFAFGARAEPTLWLSDRLRLWLTAGVGWGRMHVPEIAVSDPVHGAFTVPDRSSVYVEFPLGIGAGVDIIERWLALQYEVVAVPLSGQSGSALEHVQAVDAAGQLLDVRPLEELDMTFVHSLGLALIL